MKGFEEFKEFERLEKFERLESWGLNILTKLRQCHPFNC